MAEHRCQRCAVIATDNSGREFGLHVGEPLGGIRLVKAEVVRPDVLQTDAGADWMGRLRLRKVNELQAALYAEINELVSLANDAGMDVAVPWLRRQREREFAPLLHKAQL